MTGYAPIRHVCARLRVVHLSGQAAAATLEVPATSCATGSATTASGTSSATTLCGTSNATNQCDTGTGTSTATSVEAARPTTIPGPLGGWNCSTTSSPHYTRGIHHTTTASSTTGSTASTCSRISGSSRTAPRTTATCRRAGHCVARVSVKKKSSLHLTLACVIHHPSLACSMHRRLSPTPLHAPQPASCTLACTAAFPPSPLLRSLPPTLAACTLHIAPWCACTCSPYSFPKRFLGRQSLWCPSFVFLQDRSG